MCEVSFFFLTDFRFKIKKNKRLEHNVIVNRENSLNDLILCK